MSDVLQKNMLKQLLLRTQHKSRLWAALAALCVGTTLLLLSQLAIAGFVIVSVPTGFIAALLTLVVVVRRAISSSVRTAPLAQPA